MKERYPQFLAGTLPPSRNEVVQLGFRLSQEAKAQGVYGIDVDGDFPYTPLLEFTKAHGDMGLLDGLNAQVDRLTLQLQDTIDHQGIMAGLERINDPKRLSRDNDFYRTALRIGAGDQQPGVDLVSAWYRRNLLICANLLQLAKPGDRIVVFYGFGHAFLLRQCVAETPGFELVEPEKYLGTSPSK